RGPRAGHARGAGDDAQGRLYREGGVFLEPYNSTTVQQYNNKARPRALLLYCGGGLIWGQNKRGSACPNGYGNPCLEREASEEHYDLRKAKAVIEEPRGNPLEYAGELKESGDGYVVRLRRSDE